MKRGCKTVTVSKLKRGEYFTKKDIKEPKDCQIWIKGAYDYGIKKYLCTRFDDFNRTAYISGTCPAFTDFTF